MGRPALTLILCSRNDQYMGNSLWRLQTTLNYAAQNVHTLHREADVEIIVADWGSATPLRDVLQLSPAAARTVSFILIPPETARDLQKDSPFPEVLALNAAARRARGEYIGRMDQDMLVGKRFLKTFFELYEGVRQLEVPLSEALLFANQRMVPYRFIVRCPSLWAVDNYINWFGRHLQIELTSWSPFYSHGVGIWLAHRDLWKECGGYDERMIYMNAMEINMIARLMRHHEMVNLGELADYDFYHLEHYHPLAPRRSSIHRKVNPVQYEQPDVLNPNGSEWGLVKFDFERLPYSRNSGEVETPSLGGLPSQWCSLILMVVTSSCQILWDKAAASFMAAKVVWRRRASVAWQNVRGQPFYRWPWLLASLWARKQREWKQEDQVHL